MTIKRVFMILAMALILYPAYSFSGEVNLPRTGQTTCYDVDGNVIDCAGTGQDGDIQAGVDWPSPRFADNGDGTMTDNLTGLIWLKNGNCSGGMEWDDAISFSNNLASGQCGLSDGSAAGDWRLPNIVELESLVNAEESSPSTWLNDQGFSNVQSSYYWSSTTYSVSVLTDYAWFVYLGGGHVRLNHKSYSGYVWPVRDGPHTQQSQTWRTGQTTCYDMYGNVIACTGTGQDGDIQAGVDWPSPRFQDNGDSTITDHLTGLIWLKDVNCVGEMEWDDAISFSHNLTSGSCGLTDGSVAGDWRLPNRKELMSLIDYSQYSPALQAGHPFSNTQSSYFWWSSTTDAGDSGYAWRVSLGYGSAYPYNKSYGHYVWPVRAGQSGSLGHLIINIEPISARNAGAQWRVNGGTWHNSGETQSGLSVGEHTVEFKAIDDWIKSANIEITITEGQTTQETGTYTPIDTDQDGIYDYIENDSLCLNFDDRDTDDDGIVDGVEDENQNGFVDSEETDPCNVDTDEDGIQDGTESGLMLDDIGPDTDVNIFVEDADPNSITDPLLDNTDNDGIKDGKEDKNYNGRVDEGETDPNVFDRRALPFLSLLLSSSHEICNDGMDNDFDDKIDCDDSDCAENVICITPSPMALIPSGCFDMGDSFNEGGTDELPVHNVCISGFYMDVHEVTNAEYAACVSAGECTAPSYSSSQTRPSYYYNPTYDDFPVIYVSYNQASDYCAWMGKRLPTEAEWEYAARGGLSNKRYPWGDTISGTDANYLDSGDPWDNDTSPVGYYAANGYGLYDMTGNVFEWVNDWYQSNYYSVSPANDPPGPASGTYRVFRGGGWIYPWNLYVAYRGHTNPTYQLIHTGFRCAAD